VTRQYCGTLGKVGNCQLSVFVAYASERRHDLVDKRLYLPPPWKDDPPRDSAADVPAAVGYQSTAELGLAMLRQTRAAGHLEGSWVAGGDAYGKIPMLRDALDAAGWRYVLGVPQTTLVSTQPTTPPLVPGAAPPQRVQAVADDLPATAWHDLIVAECVQGPRTYQFVTVCVRESRPDFPGRACWLLLPRNLDDSEPRYYLSNAPVDTPLLTLAQVAVARWVIEFEFEFETDRGETGLNEEVGQQGHHGILLSTAPRSGGQQQYLRIHPFWFRLCQVRYIIHGATHRSGICE